MACNFNLGLRFNFGLNALSMTYMSNIYTHSMAYTHPVAFAQPMGCMYCSMTN